MIKDAIANNPKRRCPDLSGAVVCDRYPKAIVYRILELLFATDIPFRCLPSWLGGHDCGLLRRNFALDKVGGLLGLRRGGNQQPRIRLEPCNPRVEIGG